MKLPRCKYGFSIELHMPIPTPGQDRSVAEELASLDAMNAQYTFVTPDTRERAIQQDKLWVAIWYPDTENGQYAFAAATLEELISAIDKFAEEESQLSVSRAVK